MEYRKKSGIILYETMIAAIVITVCISITLRAFSTSLKSAKTAENYLKANVLLKNKFADFFIMPSLDAGEYEGTFTEEPNVISWNAIIEEITETEGIIEESDSSEEMEEPDYFKIILTVSWEEGTNHKKISMMTFISKEEPETEETTAQTPTLDTQDVINDEIREESPPDEGAVL